MSLTVDIEKRMGDFRLRARFECGDGVTGLLGPSGCGKSLTLKCIAGIERPDRGRIALDGRVLFDAEKHINLTQSRMKAIQAKVKRKKKQSRKKTNRLLYRMNLLL